MADDATKTDTKENGANSIATVQQTVIRCATYARYSSDLQRQTSVEDQVRSCRQAGEQGLDCAGRVDSL